MLFYAPPAQKFAKSRRLLSNPDREPPICDPSTGNFALATFRRCVYNTPMQPAADTALPIHDRVLHVVNLIRPAVQADGGDIELVTVTPAGQVQIRFHGACVGCPSSHMTLQMGIERNIRERVPEVSSVIAVQ